MSEANTGQCMSCGGEFKKAAIKKHLDKCLGSVREPGGEKFYLISVQGRYDPAYWLYVEVSAAATLDKLDAFLRGIWLECCGHLSAFRIGGQSYSVSPDRDFGDRSMNVKLNKVLEKGMSFEHEYDFGSTTSLKLKVVDERDGKKGKAVVLLARNVEPHIQCSNCKEEAVNVCCECIYDGDGWLCESCSESHECGEEMLLPVVNSPRVGVCGYSG